MSFLDTFRGPKEGRGRRGVEGRGTKQGHKSTYCLGMAEMRWVNRGRIIIETKDDGREEKHTFLKMYSNRIDGNGIAPIYHKRC